MSSACRVVICDDSLLFRSLLRKILGKLEQMDLVGSCTNGQEALRMVLKEKPDLLLLDVEMPGINGLEVLQKLQHMPQAPKVIIISAHTEAGAETTIRALELGALDFIAKSGMKGNANDNMEFLRSQLLQKMPMINLEDTFNPDVASKHLPVLRTTRPPIVKLATKNLAPTGKIRIVAIGISTGGPKALTEMLTELPVTYRLPILIVQHMPPAFLISLAETLNRKCALKVKIAEHGEAIKAGYIYIAPGKCQMGICLEKGSEKIDINETAPEENHCKPAADYLFRSLAKQMAKQTLGLIMTGMGNDGCKGLQLLNQAGGTIYAQDKKSCTIYGMPREVIKAGIANKIIPLNEIAEALIHVAHRV